MAILKKFFGINPDERTNPPAGLRGTGVEGGKGIFDEYFNQMLFETQADHIIDTEANVKLATDPTGTCYYNSTSTEFQDRNDATVTFLDGDRIVWRGLDAITANIDISTIDDLEHVMFQGVTIALGTYDLDLGENQRGELDLSGTGALTVLSSDGLRIDSSGGLAVDVQSGDRVINSSENNKLVDFESKNLIIDQLSITEVDVVSDSIKLIDQNNNSLLINNLSETVDITTDLNAGTEKNSTWYQIWVTANSERTIENILVPDLQSVTDGTSASQLIDSTASFITDAVQPGDIVRNAATKAQTTVLSVGDQNTLNLDDDIIVSGQQYLVHILTPQITDGYIYKANVGSIFNDSSGDLSDVKIFYTNPNPPKRYTGDGSDFTVSGTNWTTDSAFATVWQTEGFVDESKWMMSFQIDGSVSAAVTSLNLTISEVIYDSSITGQAFGGHMGAGVWLDDVKRTFTTGTTVLSLRTTSNAFTLVRVGGGSIYLDSKPTFAFKK